MIPVQVREFERHLARNPALADTILADPERFPPVRVEPERVIRTSSGNIARAVCRSIARCRERGDFWKSEVIE